MSDRLTEQEAARRMADMLDQMMRDGRFGHLQLFRQITHTRIRQKNLKDDFDARRIAKRFKQLG